MIIRSKNPNDIKPSEITSPEIYQARRRFIQQGIGLALAAGLGAVEPAMAARGKKLPKVLKTPYGADLKPNGYEDVTTYNNFYEFGTDKRSPARTAHTLKTKPWKVKVDGEVEKPGDYDFEDLVRTHQLEERIYRFRCVEAWSMVVPWVGIPLAEMIKRFKPTSKAKYVAFETLYDPEQMPGQKRRVLAWPYVEGLRMDEAMHPLTLMVVGLYGEVLPNQNGAPLRLIVPWKYGFKSIKSIVRIRFTEKRPPTSWSLSAPREYGFYANVNPLVDHPRWSQAKERVLGGSWLARKQATLPFNGYGEEVAKLYSGMDLRKSY